MTRRDFTRALVRLIAAAPILAAGCGSGRKIVPVSGRVMIDGEPLTYGKVQLVPVDARPAIGVIGTDGRFTLGTNTATDGAAVGKHKVAVIAHETLGPGSQKWHAPKKYMSTDTSELTATIGGPTADLVITLTWTGNKPNKPFVEKFEKEK